MAMKTEYDAPAPFDYEVWQPDPDWDCSPELQPIERDTLIKLAQYVVGRHGNDSNLLIVFYVQIMPDDFVMQLHRF